MLFSFCCFLVAFCFSKAMSEIRGGYKKLVRRQYRGWLIAAVVLFLAELSYGVFERGIGRYLVWQNASRQKIGRSWEAAQSRLLANTRLEAAQQAIRQRTGKLESLTDFEQLLNFVRANQQTLLPLSQFAVIYRALPEIFQPLLVPPDLLLASVRDRRAASALCTFTESTIAIFLLDAQDRAVYQARLANEQLQMITRHGREQQLDVISTERFAERVFPVEVFYRGLERLSPEEQGWLLRQLPILTEPDSRFMRFAVSDHMIDGFVEVAFAIDAYRSRIYYLPEKWVVEFLLPPLYENRFNQF